MKQKKQPEKLYTLEEAYEKILGIKKEMGLDRYQDKRERQAFANGYAKALNDQETAFNKASYRLASLNCFTV